MAHQQVNQLNLPAIFAAAQGVKRSQLENQLLRQKLTLGEEEQERNQLLRGLAPNVLAGDEAATTQAGAVDADLTARLVDLRGKISNEQAEAQADRWETLGRAAIRADTPEKWAREIAVISKDSPDLAQFANQFGRRQEFIDTLKTATQLFREPKDGFTLGQGQKRFDAQGNEIASVAAANRATGGFTLSPGQERFDAAGNLIASSDPAPEKKPKPLRTILSPGQIVFDENGNEIARGGKKGGKTFTLSPGQVVMDENGNEIARAPEKVQSGFSLSPGAQRFDAQGNPIANVPAREAPGFSLSPGAQRFDAQGNPIASVPANPLRPEASPEIVRLQNALAEATAAGDTKRASEIQNLIDKRGTIVGRTPQDVGPSRNRQDEIRGNIQSLSRARSTLAKVRESIVAKRGRAGLVGTASRIIQEGVGIVRDFADIGIDVPGFIAETLPEVSDDINSGAADQGISGFFDSSIPENDVFENSLAYALARARKGSGRLNRDDLINARRDTKITGLTSSDAVLSRLKAIEEELAAAEADFESRIEGETNTDDVIFEFNPSTGRLERVR